MYIYSRYIINTFFRPFMVSFWKNKYAGTNINMRLQCATALNKVGVLLQT